MKVWTNTQFEGYWPVGVAAVVVADTKEQAAYLLNDELEKRGFVRSATVEGFNQLMTSKPVAVILHDGNY
jgi:hypothetical protein